MWEQMKWTMAYYLRGKYVDQERRANNPNNVWCNDVAKATFERKGGGP